MMSPFRSIRVAALTALALTALTAVIAPPIEAAPEGQISFAVHVTLAPKWLDPADTEFLYYVLCGADGHHKFSDTYAQFERDVSTCLG